MRLRSNSPAKQFHWVATSSGVMGEDLDEAFPFPLVALHPFLLPKSDPHWRHGCFPTVSFLLNYSSTMSQRAILVPIMLPVSWQTRSFFQHPFSAVASEVRPPPYLMTGRQRGLSSIPHERGLWQAWGKTGQIQGLSFDNGGCRRLDPHRRGSPRSCKWENSIEVRA